MHRRYDDSQVTEDDINEVKSDISSLRYELLEIFERNGMDIAGSEKKEKAHLAKRMKVWERRLMKDFRVAPLTTEEPEDFSEEKGIARFRRVAKQVVSQTTTRRWDEAVRGVTDTQIGRCRNRESFRNQQNLQRAMDEAKRLVSRSPVASRSCTPVEFYDPTTNTLLELLKNITEEAGEISSHSTIRTAGSDKSAPIALQLHEIFANRAPSPLPPNVLELKEHEGRQRQSVSSMLSQHSNEDAKEKRVRSRSPSIVPPPATDIVSSAAQALAVAAPARAPSPAPVQPAATTMKSASPEPAPRPTISPTSNLVSARIQSPPPPLIQITQTDSCKLSERRKSKDNELPKVVKRRAPAPSQPAEPDIAISRPVPLKVDTKQGMIPPPPLREKKDPTPSSTSSSLQPQPRPASPVAAASPSALGSQLLSLKSAPSDSSENLVETKEPSSEANKAASSPPALRPQRKVAEVATVRRQPKTGWL